MAADELLKGDATHLRVLGDALVAAGNPMWRNWRWDFDWMYLELY